MGVTVGNGGRRRGRIVVGERDPSLTRYAGLAVTGELARRLRLVELIDAELAVERRARPVKVRRRGLSPERGKPDLLRLAHDVVRDFAAEAAMVVSNKFSSG